MLPTKSRFIDSINGNLKEQSDYPINPLSIPSILIVDSLEASSFTLNGVDIAAWLDLSGNNNDIPQGVANDQPFYNTVTKEVECDGISEFLKLTSFAGGAITQPSTIICVKTQLDNGQVYDGNGTDDHSMFEGAGQWRMSAGTTITSGLNLDANKHISILEFNGASSKFFLDGGVAKIVGDAGSDSMNGITLAQNAAGAEITNINYQFIQIINGILTTNIKNRLAAFIETRFSPANPWVAIP